MKKRKVLGLSLIVAGLIFFFLKPIGNMTGFVIANNLVSVGGIWLYFLGLSMMISGLVLIQNSSLDGIVLSSSIKNNGMLRLTKDAVKDTQVERDVNHLIKELSKGNFEAGLGKPGHVEDTDIFYLRARNGGRLYYRRTGENAYDIVGKSAKGYNQDAVIDRLKRTYSH